MGHAYYSKGSPTILWPPTPTIKGKGEGALLHLLLQSRQRTIPT